MWLSEENNLHTVKCTANPFTLSETAYALRIGHLLFRMEELFSFMTLSLYGTSLCPSRLPFLILFHIPCLCESLDITKALLPLENCIHLFCPCLMPLNFQSTRFHIEDLTFCAVDALHFGIDYGPLLETM